MRYLLIALILLINGENKTPIKEVIRTGEKYSYVYYQATSGILTIPNVKNQIHQFDPYKMSANKEFKDSKLSRVHTELWIPLDSEVESINVYGLRAGKEFDFVEENEDLLFWHPKGHTAAVTKVDKTDRIWKKVRVTVANWKHNETRTAYIRVLFKTKTELKMGPENWKVGKPIRGTGTIKKKDDIYRKH